MHFLGFQNSWDKGRELSFSFILKLWHYKWHQIDLNGTDWFCCLGFCFVLAVVGFWTQSFKLVRQLLYHLSHILALFITFLNRKLWKEELEEKEKGYLIFVTSHSSLSTAIIFKLQMENLRLKELSNLPLSDS
jgi:hypothetical protein